MESIDYAIDYALNAMSKFYDINKLVVCSGELRIENEKLIAAVVGKNSPGNDQLSISKRMSRYFN